jgi:enoyl-CoA hydratase
MSTTSDEALTQHVRFGTRGDCAIITVDRPEARNAVNPAVARGIYEGINRLECSPRLRVGVLTGAGTVFCAGADMKTLAAGDGHLLSTARGGFAGIARRDRTNPVIAAVEGAALAGGAEVALACDLIVAAEDAVIGIPEVKRGLLAAAGGVFRLAYSLPLNIAMEAALTGEPLTAELAHRHGLVNRTTPRGQALAGALELADQIIANAPLACARAAAASCPPLRTTRRDCGRRVRAPMRSSSTRPTPRKASQPSSRSGPRAGPAPRSSAWRAARRHGSPAGHGSASAIDDEASEVAEPGALLRAHDDGVGQLDDERAIEALVATSPAGATRLRRVGGDPRTLCSAGRPKDT